MKHREKTTEKLLLIIANILDFTENAVSLNRFMAAQYTPQLHSYRNLVNHWFQNKERRKRIRKAFYNLVRIGYIRMVFYKRQHGFILTPKGEKKLLKLKLCNANKDKLPHDQWLMVFFDIPEKERQKRETFRKTLRIMGFEPLQKSIWVTRYNVLKELREVIKKQELKKYAKQLLVKEIHKTK